jgi:transcriptional regulator with XRE-family HTH domain
MPKGMMTTRAVSSGNIDFSQRKLSKKEFGTRIFNLLKEKRWRQSDLARASGLGRDSISQYVRGRTFPTPVNLEKLAEALKVGAEFLLPNYDFQTNEFEDATIEFKSIESDAKNSWLKINMKLPTEKALRILQIIQS